MLETRSRKTYKPLLAQKVNIEVNEMIHFALRLPAFLKDGVREDWTRVSDKEPHTYIRTCLHQLDEFLFKTFLDGGARMDRYESLAQEDEEPDALGTQMLLADF